MNELTKEWVDKAEADFYSAELLLHAFTASNAQKNISRLICRTIKLTLSVSTI
jgi:hypothetical protein